MKHDITLTRRIALILMLMFTLTFVSPLFIVATSLDELSQEQSQQQDVGSNTEKEVITYENNVVEEQAGYTGALADYMRGYTPITEENMQFAANTMSPFVRLLGNLTGCIMVFTTAAIFLVTALDLCYIAVPVVRPFLNPQLSQGSMGGGMPMGGMGMGMGMRGMGMGMGMGGMSGGQGQMPEHGLHRKWVSDEAVTVVNQYAQPAMNQGMGGMGPMGGMGGFGYGAPQPQQQAMPVKLVIFEYFKKRVLFMVIFAIASTLLLSSIFTDCGLNIAELGVKLMNKLNGKITEVNI